MKIFIHWVLGLTIIGAMVTASAQNHDADAQELKSMQNHWDLAIQKLGSIANTLPSSSGGAKEVAKALEGFSANQPETGWKTIDALLNLLPNDSAIKPLILEFIKTMKTQTSETEKAVNQE